ncbi:hypothetical protein DFH09DRAFT_369651 [Mycena vulgaris]|nr:hypothetical protein DFH09DRAFT_369651 [Mycena vulgaris]
MSTPGLFPWTVFSANTLRPMIADVLRSAGKSTSLRLNREQSLALLEKIEKHGLEAALKDDLPENDNASASTSKRKREELNDSASSAQPKPKRGRPPKDSAGPNGEQAASVSVSRARGRTSASDPGQGLLTRRQAAQARGENGPPTRSWKNGARQPRKTAQKASGGSGSVSAPSKPKSKGQVFDGVVLVKRPVSYVGKGKAREQEEPEKDEVEEQEQDQLDGSDEDAEGEVVDDGIEMEVETEMEMESSSLENSNKENDRSLLEIANADTSTDVDAEDEEAIPAEEIGSPAPQITVEPTDDQIEDARNHDVSIEIGSPAPEIRIEPMADDGAMDEIEFEFEGNGAENENGFSVRGGLLRPRIDTHLRAGSVELNPEYSIEIYSPTSVQHDSDDEMWVAAGVNGHGNVRAAGGGLGPLDALD